MELESGSILVDGIDLSQCSLSEFRRKLSIIPQEPVLFKGTIRSNLDPFHTHEDKELWRALELSHLKSSVENFPLVSYICYSLLILVSRNWKPKLKKGEETSH